MSVRHREPYDNVMEMVGWTPLVRLHQVSADCRTPVYGKCEFMSPGGSVKDRIGLALVSAAEQDGTLHPLQEGFQQEHGLQCGFCTPGMLMTGRALLERNADPSEADIRQAISGNLCRCTGYVNIVKSIEHAAAKLGQESA